jgi:hypothetical protein
MADKAQGGFQLGQAGQPVTPSPVPAAEPAQVNQVEGSTENQPQFVTREEALQLAQQAAAEVLKQAQSLTDKSQARVMKEIDRLSKAGITATPEQVKQMVAAEEQSQQQEVPGNQAVQPEPQGLPADPVVRKAIQIMQDEGGGQITKDEPEFNMIDQKTDDPEVFLASVHAAAKAKAERTKSIGNPARMPVTASGGGTHVPNYQNMSGVDILEEYNKNHPL